MNKIILTIIVIFLLPISVYGFDWTVKYDMKKSDGSIEFLEVSVPKVKGMWKLPNQVGGWECYMSRIESKTFSNMSLDCISKENGIIHLQSIIQCNTSSRKNNELRINYPSTIKKYTSTNTIIVVNCEV